MVCAQQQASVESLLAITAGSAYVKTGLINYRRTISACERGGRWDQSFVLLVRMRDQGFRQDLASCSATATTCARGVRASHHSCWRLAAVLTAEAMDTCSAALVMVAGMAAATCVSSLLVAYANQQQWLLALSLMLKSLQGCWGVEANAYLCSSTVGVCARWQSWELAMALASEVERWGLEPDAAVHNAATQGRRGGAWSRVLAGLRNLGRSLIEPNIRSFNTAAVGCERHSQWERAWDLVHVADKGMQPDLASCGIAISALQHVTGKWSAFLTLLREAGHATVPAFNAMISSLGRSDRWEFSLLLLVQLGMMHLQVDAATMSARTASSDAAGDALLVALASAGSNSDHAHSLWRLGLLRLGRLRDAAAAAAATTSAHSACAAICKQADHWASALAVLTVAHHRQLQLTTFAHTMSLASTAESRCWSRVFELCVQLAWAGLQPDPELCTTALWACSSAACWEQAFGLLRRSTETELLNAVGGDVDRNPRRNADFVGGAVAACGAAQFWARSWHLLQEALAASEAPAAAKALSPQASQRPLPQEHKRSADAIESTPNSSRFHPMLVTMVDSCAKAGCWEQAGAVLQFAWDHGHTSIQMLSSTAWAYSQSGLWNTSLMCLSQVQQQFAADLATITSGMQACVQGSAWSAALALHESLRVPAEPTRGSSFPRPQQFRDILSYTTALAAMNRADSWAGCLFIVDEMVGHVVVPDEPAFQSAARCCGRSGRWWAAAGLLANAGNYDVDGPTHTWWSTVVWAYEVSELPVPPLT
eukprot:CAMPEP_0172884322 /NCGR_PEP_ID=MMETSP1075-20121228/124827_1 /TAXON_ID=2916 /ORGANISM="Ceratium fusus, Strain PA161109" /LENGTH=767 /DNA_ID=CAMNT_0013737401 /DNA_START=44 /DNA_END=2344 /DNA_ORIENTATION=-